MCLNDNDDFFEMKIYKNKFVFKNMKFKSFLEKIEMRKCVFVELFFGLEDDNGVNSLLYNFMKVKEKVSVFCMRIFVLIEEESFDVIYFILSCKCGFKLIIINIICVGDLID